MEREHDADVIPKDHTVTISSHRLSRRVSRSESLPLAQKLPFLYEFETGFVILCFLMGNDFYHLPLSSGFDLIYSKVLPMLNGYSTDAGEVNLSRVMPF